VCKLHILVIVSIGLAKEAWCAQQGMQATPAHAIQKLEVKYGF
jgi:hypothetical protein